MSEPGAGLLTESERAALAAVLDELLPASKDGRLPSAGEIELAVHVEVLMSRIPAVAPVIVEGLRAAGEIAAAPARERVALIEGIEQRDPSFFLALLFLAYSSYYQHPRVIAALGLEPRPPHPQGYTMNPLDLTLLDPVRRRPAMWRQA